MPDPSAGLLQELLGCAWGRTVATPDDQEACRNQAVQIVVVHDGPREWELKLCAAHRDRVLAETTPTEDPAYDPERPVPAETGPRTSEQNRNDERPAGQPRRAQPPEGPPARPARPPAPRGRAITEHPLIALDGTVLVEVDEQQLEALVECGAVAQSEAGSWCLTPDAEYPGDEEEQVMEALYRMGRLG